MAVVEMKVMASIIKIFGTNLFDLFSIQRSDPQNKNVPEGQ